MAPRLTVTAAQMVTSTRYAPSSSASASRCTRTVLARSMTIQISAMYSQVITFQPISRCMARLLAGTASPAAMPAATAINSRECKRYRDSK